MRLQKHYYFAKMHTKDADQTLVVRFLWFAMQCVSVMAQEKSTSPDPSERTAAMQLGRASIRVSIAGIIVGSVVGVFLVVINTTFATS